MWKHLVVISVYITLAHGSVAGHIESGTCVCVTGSNVNARHSGTVFLTITFTMSRYNRLSRVVANKAYFENISKIMMNLLFPLSPARILLNLRMSSMAHGFTLCFMGSLLLIFFVFCVVHFRRFFPR